MHFESDNLKVSCYTRLQRAFIENQGITTIKGCHRVIEWREESTSQLGGLKGTGNRTILALLRGCESGSPQGQGQPGPAFLSGLTSRFSPQYWPSCSSHSAMAYPRASTHTFSLSESLLFSQSCPPPSPRLPVILAYSYSFFKSQPTGGCL